MLSERLKATVLHDKIVSADEAAGWIQDGMTLGLSGFTRAGDAKEIPLALVERVKKENISLKVNVMTGASLGSDIDKLMAEAGIVNKRLPFQAEPAMRKKINDGEILFVDQHLSMTAEYIRDGVFPPIDFAIVEADSITEDGLIIPTTSVGNSSIFIEHAKEVIIELNMKQPLSLEGVHDIYSVGKHEGRQPIPIIQGNQRLGTIGIPVPFEKIRGIVLTDRTDSPSTIAPPDQETKQMANHLIAFFREEIKKGRLTNKLAPLQAGIGTIANAVLGGLIDSEFEELEIYSEVLQDSVFDLLDSGKALYASASSITLSAKKLEEVFRNFDRYKDRIILRPQEISNHPGIIRRLGIICINTALEADIYGNVNSTHVSGTYMMNGIGGSGDFARNSKIAVFVTKSTAKGGQISSIVPFVTHVDHTEHDVDVLVTEQGYVDLRGLAPRERVYQIIENCMHPQYRPQMYQYVEEAFGRQGQTPHVLEKAFSWHTNYKKKGTMLLET
ncbi:succinate CoA transferase [Ammoniphilus resinae]|uniref:Succinyl-CoA:acetate CoA-transferase n=1 Tax=Ammoniphilus resinae TaxID=861532 RepID=A0ABS4GIU5_9BACL|nr:succinate CoA transferase [Ammoniphilus resinae]MBP1930183.1 succinyl-CoA:acetate CoA-transferase [Ammoniphilus resinae]